MHTEPTSIASHLAREPTRAFPRTLVTPLALTLCADLLIFIAALLPRLFLARSLDLTTDEGVYIPVGQRDILLLAHANISSPHWLDNFEAPALPKLFIGLGSLVGERFFGAHGILLGARLPGVLLSAIALVVTFHLARPIIGDLAAWLGSMALALSPWLAYFAALAYLDTYMTILLTLAVLLAWHAARKPALFPIVGALLGLAMASKYTALAAVVPIAGYLVCDHFRSHRALPRRQLLFMALAFLGALFLADPAIWANPFSRLGQSIGFQFNHAQNGHQAFWFGRAWEHVPPGMGIAIALAKMSLFVTLPALGVVVACLTQAARRRRWPDDPSLFLTCWLVGLIAPFSGLTIIVGTHYLLPLAPAFAIAGAWGLTSAARWLAPRLSRALGTIYALAASHTLNGLFVAIALLVVIPPLFGLLTVRQAEGYTSEWLSGEDSALQVAYPAYADALAWVEGHTQGAVSVALIALPGTLDYWMQERAPDFPPRVTLLVGTPDRVPPADFIVWPEHLIQRGFPRPPNWLARILTAIKGGATIYCYVLSG